MDYVDFRFFQAGAVVIPTLFIAFSITGRVLEVNTTAKTHLPLLSDTRKRSITSVAGVALFFAVAEMVCLATIAAGQPSRSAMFFVVASVSMMIWMICYQALIPALETHSKTFAVALFLAPLLVLLAVFAITFTELGGLISGER